MSRPIRFVGLPILLALLGLAVLAAGCAPTGAAATAAPVQGPAFTYFFTSG
jgi:hypothetical protein